MYSVVVATNQGNQKCFVIDIRANKKIANDRAAWGVSRLVQSEYMFPCDHVHQNFKLCVFWMWDEVIDEVDEYA
jgi:hypothetical protein